MGIEFTVGFVSVDLIPPQLSSHNARGLLQFSEDGEDDEIGFGVSSMQVPYEMYTDLLLSVV